MFVHSNFISSFVAKTSEKTNQESKMYAVYMYKLNSIQT